MPSDSSGGPGFFKEENTRMFYVARNENVKSNTNTVNDVSHEDFLGIFYGGDLDHMKDNLIAFRGFKGVFKITFKEIDAEVRRLEKYLKTANILLNSDKKRINLRMSEAWQPTKTLSFHPVPAEYDLEVFKQVILSKGWGTPVAARRGYYRNYPTLHNYFIHMKITDLKEEVIPQVFDLQGHTIYVKKPSEVAPEKCDYCHGAWHTEDNCYKKGMMKYKGNKKRKEECIWINLKKRKCVNKKSLIRLKKII